MTIAPDRRSLLPMFDLTHGKRSAVTCHLRCGDACSKPVPNTTETSYFRDVAATALSRRGVLGGAGVLTLTLASGAVAGPAAAARHRGGLPFTAIPPVVKSVDDVTVPSGYRWDALIRWGDPILDDAPDFDASRQSPQSQAGQFGYNCDYLDIIVTDRHGRRAVLVANHEYTNENIMFPPGTPAETVVRTAWAAHGMSVVELRRRDEREPWTYKQGAALNRRITLDTVFEVDGPDVDAREPREGDLHHGEVAQQLLDHPVRLLAAREQHLPGLRAAGDEVGTEAEHARRGLVAAEEHTVGEPAQRDVVERVAVVGEQPADEAGAGLGTLPGHGTDEELPRRGRRAEGAHAALGEVEAGHAQALEALAVLDRQPEQLADHLERHREGEVLDQVEVGALRLEDVEPVGDDPLDEGLEAGQLAAGELRGEVAAQLRVQRRVGHPEPADLLLRAAPLRDQLPHVVGERRAVGQQRPGVVVRRHEPHAATEEVAEAGHRALLAQPADLRHRVEAVAAEGGGEPVGHPAQSPQVEAAAAHRAGQQQASETGGEPGTQGHGSIPAHRRTPVHR